MWNKIELTEKKKREIKCTKKGGLGLLDIQQFINGLNLIWIHNFLNNNHKWKNFVPSFPIIRTLDDHRRCLILKKQQLKFVLEAYNTGL